VIAGTRAGKSLVFQAHILDPRAADTQLVIIPTKALIHVKYMRSIIIDEVHYVWDGASRDLERTMQWLEIWRRISQKSHSCAWQCRPPGMTKVYRAVNIGLPIIHVFTQVCFARLYFDRTSIRKSMPRQKAPSSVLDNQYLYSICPPCMQFTTWSPERWDSCAQASSVLRSPSRTHSELI